MVDLHNPIKRLNKLKNKLIQIIELHGGDNRESLLDELAQSIPHNAEEIKNVSIDKFYQFVLGKILKLIQKLPDDKARKTWDSLQDINFFYKTDWDNQTNMNRQLNIIIMTESEKNSIVKKQSNSWGFIDDAGKSVHGRGESFHGKIRVTDLKNFNKKYRIFTLANGNTIATKEEIDAFIEKVQLSLS